MGIHVHEQNKTETGAYDDRQETGFPLCLILPVLEQVSQGCHNQQAGW